MTADASPSGRNDEGRGACETPAIPAAAPSRREFKEIAVYKHILIATDGSELAGRALAAGLGLAKVLHAQVTVVTATEPWSAMVIGEPALIFPIQDYEKAAAEKATRILASAGSAAKDAGVTCETVHVSEFPAEGIIATAKDKGCDLIVMSSHGRRGLSKLILGSQATHVLALSTVPVLICR
jgi:nucleotide-binding universal stress UspA family protein